MTSDTTKRICCYIEKITFASNFVCLFKNVRNMLCVTEKSRISTEINQINNENLFHECSICGASKWCSLLAIMCVSLRCVPFSIRECRSIRWIWGRRLIKLAYLSFWYLSRWEPFQKGILPFERRLLWLYGRWYLYGRSQFHPSLIRFRPVGWAMCTQTEQKMCRKFKRTRAHAHHTQMHTHLGGRQNAGEGKKEEIKNAC